MARMVKTSNELCAKCKYHYGGNNSGVLICDYLAKTGKRRNCDIGKCDKFEKGDAKDKWDEILIE